MPSIQENTLSRTMGHRRYQVSRMQMPCSPPQPCPIFWGLVQTPNQPTVASRYYLTWQDTGPPKASGRLLCKNFWLFQRPQSFRNACTTSVPLTTRPLTLKNRQESHGFHSLLPPPLFLICCQSQWKLFQTALYLTHSPLLYSNIPPHQEPRAIASTGSGKLKH